MGGSFGLAHRNQGGVHREALADNQTFRDATASDNFENMPKGTGPSEIKNRIDPAQQMIAWNVAFKPKLVEQKLQLILTPHHRGSPHAKHTN